MMSPAQHSNHVPHPPAYQNYPTNQLSPSSTNSYSSSVSTFTGSDNSPYIPSYPYNYVPNYGQATMPTHCPSNGSSPTSDTSEGPGHVGSGGRGVLLADSVSPPNYSGYYAQLNGDIRPALEISRQHEWKQKKSRPHQSNGPYNPPGIQGPSRGNNVHATATSGALVTPGWPNQTLPILQVGFLSLSNHSNTSK